MLTPKLKIIGAENHPYLEDADGRKSFAPVRFFSVESAEQYVAFVASKNIDENDARYAVWPSIAKWKN